MFKFACFNVFRRKVVLFIAILGTGLGVGLMTSLMSLSEGVDQKMSQTANIISGDITITAESSSLSGFTAEYLGGGDPLPSSYINRIEKLENVEITAPYVTANIPAKFLETGSPVGTTVTGIDPEADRKLEGGTTQIYEGQTFQKNNEIIFGKNLLRQIKMADNEIEIGDEINFPLIDPENPSAPPTENILLTVVGFFETGNSLLDGRAFSNLETARNLSNLEDSEISYIKVRTVDTDLVEEVAEEIKKEFTETEIPVEISLAKNNLSQLQEMMDILDIFVVAIGAISAVAGGLSIFIIMLMNVMDRMKEFGIFKAAGWSNRNIIFSVIMESLIVSLLGAGFGLSLGYLVTQVVDHVLEEGIALITLNLILKVLSFGITMGIAGGIYPALQAARVSPMKTLRTE